MPSKPFEGADTRARRRRDPDAGSLRRLRSALALSLLAAGAGAQDGAPLVPGLHGRHGLSEALAGRVLVNELRCGSCHVGAGATASPPGPDLSGVGLRADPHWIERFLLDPSGTRAGSKMPAMLDGEPAERRGAVARELTAFLVSLSAEAEDPSLAGGGDADRGSDLYHGVGCVACHAPRAAPKDAGASGLPLTPGAIDLEHVPAKYDEGSLAAFLFRPDLARPSGRMPDLGLSRAEARDLAAYLIGDGRDARPYERTEEEVAAGRAHFQRLRCGACHAIDGLEPPPPAPMRVFDPGRGCLSEESRGTPRYTLDADQLDAVQAALILPEYEHSDEERIAQTLASLNCTACHARGEHGGVPEALNPYFTTSELGLGDEARIPPPLTGVGAKLDGVWLRRVLFDGGGVRGRYLHTRMPRFGAANLAHLPELLERADAGTIEPFAMASPEGDRRRELRDAGRELMGIYGLSCVSCHDFKAKPAPTHRGLDLVDTTERLQPSWFARFLLDPQGLRPNIVMPQSWPGGRATHQGILDGDTEAQIQALWYFLSQGRTAGDPEGLVSIPTRLDVTDRVLTYRGRGFAGFRGIAVGFPGGLSYAFDARTGALAGLWSGDFVRLSWGGQGAGDFHPNGRAVRLARDVAFHGLADGQAPWPLRPRTTKEEPVDPDPDYPRNFGYRFRGYTLDVDDVPTLRYAHGDLEVEDRSEADTSGERPVLRRRLAVRAAGPGRTWFRVLAGKIDLLGGRTFGAPRLRVTIPDVPWRIRPLAGEPGQSELLLDLTLPAGATNLDLEYELLP